MENKLNFEVTNIEILQDSLPQFSKLKLQIVREGNNAHNIPITQTAIDKAMYTLVGKPILCHYDKGKFGGHEEGQIPVGVVLNKEDVFYESIDGINWLCAYAFIWKRYFPNIVEVFKESSENKSKLSMEIDVLEISNRNDGLTWIEAFAFTGITLIGVPEAIPGANATVLEFSKVKDDFEKDKLLLFSQITHFPKHGENKQIHLKNSNYLEFDFDYATALKDEYPSVWSKGGNLRGEETFTLWSKARAEDKSSVVLDWIKERESWAKRHIRDRSIGGVIAQLKWGVVSDYGLDKMKETIENEKKNHDAKNRAYFEGGEKIMPYESLKDVNPALKGIDPPISLGQANAIAKQADAIGVDKDKNGWAIAISSFKKTHTVKDGKWVEKDKKEFEKEVIEKMTEEEKKIEEERIAEEEKKKKELEFAAEEEKKKLEMVAEEEKKQKEADEKAAEEKKAKEAEGKKFALAEFADIEKLSKFMAGEEFEADFAAEAGKESEVNFGLVVKYMFAKMCKMAEDIEAIKKDKDAYMSKHQEYEAKFAEIEKQKFSIAVESLLKDKDISESLSKDEVEECRADAVNFSLETISGWENKVKALAFTHSKGKKIDTVLQYALPFHDEPEKSNLLFK